MDRFLDKADGIMVTDNTANVSATDPLLRTKLYIPSVQPNLVPRPRLTARLNPGLHRKLTLISAPTAHGDRGLPLNHPGGDDCLNPGTDPSVG